MEKTKICMGCFEELPDDTMVCSICGFDNKTIKREVQKWCQGAVIEKRWLLGCRFSQSLLPRLGPRPDALVQQGGLSAAGAA